MNERNYYENPVLWTDSYWSERETLRATLTTALLPSDVKSVLDVGCGAGIVSRIIGQNVQFVCGSDFAFEPLRQVKEYGLHAIQADITTLPLKEKSFDAVVLTEVLEHIPPDNLHLAVNEISRVARLYILITVPYRESLFERNVKCGNCARIYHSYHHYNSFDENLLCPLFMPNFKMSKIQFLGDKSKRTPKFFNSISCFLSDYKYPVEGSFSCPSCGSAMAFSNQKSVISRLITKTTNHFLPLRSHSEWIAILYFKCDYSGE